MENAIEIEMEQRERVRQSYSGGSMTESQIDKSIHFAGIVRRDIQKTGSFIKPVSRYAETYAEGERFDATRAETIIRDAFKAVYSESMNEMRLRLAERENSLRDAGSEQALYYAERMLRDIQEGQTMPLYQADDRAAVAMAQQHGITEIGARSMMKEVYQAATGRNLYEVGKELERTHHTPKKEAARMEKQAQQNERVPAMSRS